MTAAVDDAEPGQVQRGSIGHRGVIAFCFGIALLEGFDIQSMGVAAPRMLPALGLTPATAGLLFSASLLGMIPGALIGGWLSPRYGHRNLLALALLIFGVFTLLTAGVADVAPLCGIRVLAGLGLGAAMPSLIAVAAHGVSMPRRAAVVSGMTAGIPLGAAFAALVGRFVLAADWRWVFVVGGVLPILFGLAALRTIPAQRDADIVAAEEPGSSDPLASDWRALTLLLCAGYLFTLMALLLLMNWLPSLLTGAGLTLGSVGLVILGFNLGGAVGGLVLGRGVERFGTMRTLVVIYAGVCGLLLILSVARLPVGGLTALMFLIGFLLMGGQCVLYGLGAAVYPAMLRARGVGLAIASGRIGAACGPTLAGLLLANAFGLKGVMIATAAILAVGGAATLASVRRARPDGPPATALTGASS